jgi:putative ABC transport system permease protein
MGLWQEFRFAVRLLWKSPSFTAIALFALVLGIGANTAIFSVVNATLIRPMPFRDPERLVAVWERSPRTGKNNVINPQNFADWRDRNRSFEKMAAYAPLFQGATITGDGNPESVSGCRVTRDFFAILGVRPVLGRDFQPEDDTLANAGTEQVALISNGFWQRRYGADTGILGKKLIVQGHPTTVIGILPANFHFLENQADIWVLHHINAQAPREGRYLAAIARLKPGATTSQAQADMSALAARLAEENPAFDTRWGASVVPLREQATGDLRTPLLVLLSAVGLVLLIGCANVANLMLMHSSARQRELAIRASLGATRGRIVRQLLIESGILGISAGVLALLCAVWAKDGLMAILPESLALVKVNEVTIDRNVLAFTALLSLLTPVLFGLLPAIQTSRPSLVEILKEGGRASSASLRRNRLRATLVAGEIAIALVLLIGAGLLIESFFRLEHVAPGFQTERVLSLRLNLTSPRYKDDQATAVGLGEILHRIESIPGVQSAGSIHFPPLGGLRSATGFYVAGRPVPKPSDEPITDVSVVTPGYFATMSIPLLRGRLFTGRDRDGAPRVAMVSESLAREQFASMNPIGQHIFVQWGRTTPYEIVGVVGDVKPEALDQDFRPTVYFPDAQEPSGGATAVIRASADPMKLAPVIQQVIHAYDLDQAIADIQPFDALLSKSVERPRFQTVLLASFAGLALLLAIIGITGVVSYSVAQRSHEIGIRVALGASRKQVLRLVVGQSLVLALIGIAVGLAGALVLTRYLRTLIFEISPRDPLTLVTIPALLLAVALAASYFPARRATRVDPMQALRYE